MTHRVVVTGIGVVTPIGIGVDALWEATLAERIAIKPITRFPTDGYRSKLAAQVENFDAANFMSARRIRWTDRFSQFAVAATRLAIDDAKVAPTVDDDEVGVFMGSALGGLAYADEQHDVFREKGLEAIRPLLAISVFGGASTCNVAMEFGFSGPNVANGNSCASGAVAIGDAYRAIARGEIRAAVAGGVEAPLAPLIFGAFTVIRAMSTRNDDPEHASRPFDLNRDGFVMAEGSGVLYLERYEDAVRRGARIYGEIVGYGLTNDAHHMSAPRPDGVMAARAMTKAMHEAHVTPNDVDLINAHGSGTAIGDASETLAFGRAFGDALPGIPVTATKGQHGHALGATGAWEAALSLLSIAHQTVPKSVNSTDEDPDCRLPITRERLDLAPRVILSNSAGFGGINAALVFQRVDA